MSERRRTANRSNAQKSTGPKSRAGKERASQNSYRHGLSARFQLDSDWTAKLERLARDILDRMGDRMDLGHARSIAQAQLEVLRARSVSTAAVKQMFTDCALISSIGRRTPFSTQQESIETDRPATAESIKRALSELQRLDRYECRALARRDRVVRRYLDGVPSQLE
jgi:hypothetical protein